MKVTFLFRLFEPDKEDITAVTSIVTFIALKLNKQYVEIGGIGNEHIFRIHNIETTAELKKVLIELKKQFMIYVKKPMKLNPVNYTFGYRPSEDDWLIIFSNDLH